MTDLDDRLTRLLQAAPEPPAGIDIDVDAVAHRVRRHRRAVAGAAVTAVAAAVAAVVALASLAGPGTAGNDVGPAKTPRPAPQPRTATYHGVTFVLPQGWTQAPAPGCGEPADQTVAVGDPWAAIGCPGSVLQRHQPTYVELRSMYGRQYALGADGPVHRVVRDGQPAWLGRDTIRHTLTKTTVTTYLLYFPWLNATAAATAPDARTARHLLDRVHAAAPSGTWSVPPHASSVFIESLAGRDGDGQQRNATLTAPGDVARMLADLRDLHPTTDVARACDLNWYAVTAMVTVRLPDRTSRAYAVRFDRCAEVMDGSGSAATAGAALRDDIRRFVPNSALPG